MVEHLSVVKILIEKVAKYLLLPGLDLELNINIRVRIVQCICQCALFVCIDIYLITVQHMWDIMKQS